MCVPSGNIQEFRQACVLDVAFWWHFSGVPVALPPSIDQTGQPHRSVITEFGAHRVAGMALVLENGQLLDLRAAGGGGVTKRVARVTEAQEDLRPAGILGRSCRTM